MARSRHWHRPTKLEAACLVWTVVSAAAGDRHNLSFYLTDAQFATVIGVMQSTARAEATTYDQGCRTPSCSVYGSRFVDARYHSKGNDGAAWVQARSETRST